jgi:predicted N-acyltransferase
MPPDATPENAPGERILTLEIHQRLAEVPKQEWDALESGGSPFLEWEWLSALEATRCAVPETGWAPQHLVIREGGRILAACPLYLKTHSQGEFIFDHQWAYAAERAGVSYYPKLLAAVPFTPAGGLRVLTAPGAARPALVRFVGETLAKLAEEHELSSVHINFCTEDEVAPLREAGYVARTGIQYHWENRGYRDFEDYLEQFRSKKRNQIRRERREMAERGVEIRVLAGGEIPDALLPDMFALYKGHVDKLYWGRQYLSPEFFERLGSAFKRNLVFVVAEKEGRLIAGTFNVQKGGVFYGRYWGANADVPFLHFNVCYYSAIEHCIRAGVRRFEPGAGGEFKHMRGFEARLTHSMHRLHPPELHDAVARYLRNERAQVARTAEFYREHSPLKSAQESTDPV